MKYEYNRLNDRKPLSEFYNSECFIADTDNGDVHLYMVVGFESDVWEYPGTRFALDIDEAEVVLFWNDEMHDSLDVTIYTGDQI